MKCENCIHYGVCVVNSYCHEPCGYYEEDRPRGEWKEFTVSTYRGTDEWGEPKWGKGKKFICKRCGRGMRLIDADALKRKFRCSYDGSKGDCYAPTCKGCRDNVLLEEDIDKAPTIEPKQGEWEYIKEHITEMRDADGELNQKDTCRIILNLMGVIEKEGESSAKDADNRKSS